MSETLRFVLPHTTIEIGVDALREACRPGKQWSDGALRGLPTDVIAPILDDREELLRLARAVTAAYTMEAEDANDGEFAIWENDGLVSAIVALRARVGS